MMRLRPLLLFSLPGLYIACQSCTSVRAPEPPPSPALRVLTFNLDVNAQEVEPALRAIEQANPDVVCLQEVSPHWEQTLTARFRHRFPQMQFLNVHLRPPATDGGNKIIGVFTAGGPRKRETASLLTHLRPGLATIVLGDFNEGDRGGSVSLIKSKAFTDCLPQFDAHTPTWRLPSGLIRISERADHILYSAELHCTDARVIPESASDHDPVLAILGKAR